MSRVGWIALAVFVAVAAVFASLVRFGPAPRPAPTPSGEPALLAMPVAGVERAALRDTWGEARGGGRAHHGTDIPAPAGTPVLAAAPGTVEKLFTSRLGGTALYIRSRARRWTYYYAHLSGYAPGLREGQAVRQGETVAFVGDTGDAGPGNFHLHFGLTRTSPDQHWWQGEDVDAYPYLAANPPGR